jgi:hypothetical protein
MATDVSRYPPCHQTAPQIFLRPQSAASRWGNVWITSVPMASKLQCDDARWPLVILSAPVQWGVDSVVRYIEETTNLSERGSPFALVFDLTQSALPAIDARRRLAAHRRWLYQHAGERLVTEGVVVSSRAHQESFLVQGEQQDVHPRLQYFIHVDTAISAAITRLTERGLAVTSIAPRASGVLFKPPRKAYPSEPEFEATAALTLRRFS